MLEPRENNVSKTGWRQIGWFIGLWALGVGVVGIVGGVIKLVLA